LLIEATDVIFAVDSVPAVLAVSNEPFIVFASNAFAILGLRALYFLLADMHDRFMYLQQGLAIILAFVGIKMIIAEWYHIPTWLSLTVIALVLSASIGFSLKANWLHGDSNLAGRAFADGVGEPAEGADDAADDGASQPAGAPGEGDEPPGGPTTPTP
ncbi:MAG: TerC family protein, partial [Ilumatobacteraceae bacterium]